MKDRSFERAKEYFKSYEVRHKNSLSHVPPQLYRQERDWTCSVACIRTMLSGVCEQVASEDEIISKYQLEVGPHYSRDIKAAGILEGHDVIYGCDLKEKDIDMILDLMEQGYYIMLETMINYAHWLVLAGYYTVQSDKKYEEYRLLFFDPYYNEMRLVNFDEFLGMWIDGNYANSKVEKDFIAVR